MGVNERVEMNFINELIANGCEIFPVTKDKRPCTTHGLKDATNDIETINQWRSKFPNCRWAVRLDKANLIVADFDNHTSNNNGTKLFEQLPKEQQDFLKTCPIDRSNHGFHFFMKLPKGQKLDQARYEISNGLEILTLQVNLYEPNKPILEAPEAPKFNLDMLKPKNEAQFNFSVNNSQSKTRWAGKIINKIADGDGLGKGDGRNTFLNELSGFLFNKFTLADPDAIEYVMQLVNEHVFAEPLPRSEFNSVLKSAIKKYTKELGAV